MKCMCPTCKSADYENKTILMVHWIQAQLAFSVHEERTNWSRKTGQLENMSVHSVKTTSLKNTALI